MTKGDGPRAKVQARTKLYTLDKSRFYISTELAEKNNFEATVELQEGVKANLSKAISNAVFKSKTSDMQVTGEIEEQKVVQQIDLYV